MKILMKALKWTDDILPGHLLSMFHVAVHGELLHLSLDVTGSCNLDCRMCSLKLWHPPGPNLTETILTRLDAAFAVVRSVDLFSECEPLLHPRLPEIISHIKQINSRACIQVVTNGTLLTPGFSRALVQSGLDSIGFSVDSPRPEGYEAIRVGARFDQVIENIRDFIAVRNEMGGTRPRVDLIAVLFKTNEDELCDLVVLAAKLGMDCVRVNGLEPYTEEMAHLVLYGNKKPGPTEENFNRAKRLARRLGIEIRLPSLSMRPNGPCILRRCLVDSRGNVYPCAAYAYEKPYYSVQKASIFPRLTFGNVVDQDFMEIWNSHEYRKFRRNISGGKLPGPCQTCLTRIGVIHPR